MASVGDMAMDMASLEDDQSGSYVVKKAGTSVNAMRPDLDDDEQEAGQSFDQLLLQGRSAGMANEKTSFALHDLGAIHEEDEDLTRRSTVGQNDRRFMTTD